MEIWWYIFLFLLCKFKHIVTVLCLKLRNQHLKELVQFHMMTSTFKGKLMTKRFMP